MISQPCRLCNAAGPHETFTIREMMFGTRDRFRYFQCSECTTLQITDIPGADALASYYGANYYSFQTVRRNPLRRWLIEQRDLYCFNASKSPIGYGMSKLKPESTASLIGSLIVDKNAHILDVGCGSGELLERMAMAGYTKLAGADPFITADLVTKSGVEIKKKYIREITEEFDVIMFNHSLEHVPDPIQTLRLAGALLREGGRLIVRVPTVSCDVWTIYGVNWVQIDAPRHFVIPSRQGMAEAARRSGLRIVDTIDDSGEFQFTGSELYALDIPLSDPRRETTFGRKDIRDYRNKARELNKRHRGDQAAFILTA